MLLASGADPKRRTLPDSNYPDGVTPLGVTTSKSVKKLLKDQIALRKAAAAEANPHDESTIADQAAGPKDEV